MGNSYFAFKQFTVQQDKCAMKVCTDACLFGAVAAGYFNDNIQPLHVLDIGTGTGLLSLMFAQKNDNAIINAVEIDESAAVQANENFTSSPWKERLHVHHTSIQQFTNELINQSINQLYNFILTNPPFFEGDLKSPDDSRNKALHGSELSLNELLVSIQKLLAPSGVFAVLLPYHRAEYFIELAITAGYHLAKNISVKQTPHHPYFRSILFFGNTPSTIVEETITIKDDGNNYTPAFTTLLKDYYLYL